MKTLEELTTISDSFFQKALSLTESHPWAVCIAMHEYARNLFPDDPYIPFSPNECPTERIFNTTQACIDFLHHSKRVPFYPLDAAIRADATLHSEIKERTGKVYGALWSKFDEEELTKNAFDMLKFRLEVNKIDVNILAGRKTIDIGCGSGRYTYALNKLGCRPILAVDYGEDGLRIAKDVSKASNFSTVDYQQVDVLKLPFPDESFDFVFCNGVLHHTEDMERGISEMIRVAKKGAPIWLYLYADGGIFWYARKEMPKIMKKIPQTYTQAILDLIGMPSNRFIFCDNWYVPIERHSYDKDVRQILYEKKVTKIKRLDKGRDTDLEYLAVHGGDIGKIIWGDGELRYWIIK